ncbi:3-keto-disaccharide hydrolase [Catalinimonas niigatensis]|uniref:3-keto-disaccharide hydrolase n=1 Tax=Catalinimonas niigatensis TaxID=1397264 RepID=UPI0026668360|nr:DUF1080 domain-containing protein [Catalinimonas niigatensis]WPP52076.1 DUF1080 domain-containing protein [Catalinimonas niigatensis]
MKKLTLNLSVLMIAIAALTFSACSSGTNEDSSAEDSTGVATTQPEEEEWVTLVEGSSTQGWTQLNGKATYEVNGGVVTGTTKLGEPNSFLTTNKMYDDFILEYEVKVDPRMNSGVQIRSNSYDFDTTYVYTDAEGKSVEKTVESPRVHGYQIEIDPSERAYSGGIYDEARRGWLADLSENEEGRTAFKNNEWNKYRVEANGDTIRTFVNGIQTAELVDDMTDSGFIGLQVHSTDIEDPMQVQWRNIRIKEL